VDQSHAPMVQSLKADLHLEGNPTFASLFGRSAEIVSFLRCDEGTASDANQRVRRLLCDDLRK